MIYFLFNMWSDGWIVPWPTQQGVSVILEPLNDADVQNKAGRKLRHKWKINEHSPTETLRHVQFKVAKVTGCAVDWY